MLPQDIIQDWKSGELSEQERDALLILRMTSEENVKAVLDSLPGDVRPATERTMREIARTGSVLRKPPTKEVGERLAKLQSENSQLIRERVAPALQAWATRG
jgi:hypothetical protein